MDGDVERIEDSNELRSVRKQARRVLLEALGATVAFVIVLRLLVP